MTTDTGSVARRGTGASPEPMIAPSKKNRKLPAMQRAWVADNIQTCCIRGIVHWPQMGEHPHVTQVTEWGGDRGDTSKVAEFRPTT